MLFLFSVTVGMILSLDIAHRDLKPENILCEKVDEVRCLYQHVAMVIIVS